MKTDEGEELDRLVARLKARYPHLPEVDVRDAVDAAWQTLAGARLRQYAMVLIEKRAIDICRRRSAYPVELGAGKLSASRA